MKHYSKRIVFNFMIFLFAVMAISISSYAVDTLNTYGIDELAMTVDIPAEVNVVTRGIKQNDPLFQNGVYDYIETMTDIRENNIYLMGKDVNSTYKISISMTEDSNSRKYSNFKNLSSADQSALTDSLASQDMVIACSVYDTENALYYESVMKYEENGMAYFVKQYYTVINGQNINISIVSLNGQLTTHDNKIISDIVDSARYDVKSGISVGKIVGICAVIAVVIILAVLALLFAKSKRSISAKSQSPRKIKSSENNSVAANTTARQKAENEVKYTEENYENEILLNFLATDKEIAEKNKTENENLEVGKNQESTDKTMAQNVQTPTANEEKPTITEDYSVIKSIFDGNKTDTEVEKREEDYSSTDDAKDFSSIDISVDGVSNDNNHEDEDEDFNPSDYINEGVGFDEECDVQHSDCKENEGREKSHNTENHDNGLAPITAAEQKMENETTVKNNDKPLDKSADNIIDENADSDTAINCVNSAGADSSVMPKAEPNILSEAEAQESSSINSESADENKNNINNEQLNLETSQQNQNEIQQENSILYSENNSQNSSDIRDDGEGEPVDLAAAIAYFEDDFEARKARRERIKERNEKNKNKKRKWRK